MDVVHSEEGGASSRERVLDPVDRISEILFGLIMALTFTVTLDAASADDAEVHALLIAALGCNIAWGLVDGVMYMVTGLVERAHGHQLLRDLHAAETPAARSILRGTMPPLVAATVDDSELDRVRDLLARVDAPAKPGLGRDDWLGGAAVAVLVFLSTLPVALPFLFIDDAGTALRTSNGVALVMLFAAGVALARYAGLRRVRIGLLMAALGTILVPITVLLGG